MRRSLAARIAKLEWKVLGGPGHECIEAVENVIVGPDGEVIKTIRYPLRSCPGCNRVFEGVGEDAWPRSQPRLSRG